MINTKAIFPTKKEVESNPKSRSARLRVLQKKNQIPDFYEANYSHTDRIYFFRNCYCINWNCMVEVGNF